MSPIVQTLVGHSEINGDGGEDGEDKARPPSLFQDLKQVTSHQFVRCFHTSGYAAILKDFIRIHILLD